jgi:hypothetical protein
MEPGFFGEGFRPFCDPMSTTKSKSLGKLLSTEAFTLGLSGFGMFVAGSDKRISALQRGETIHRSWSNVGKYLDQSAAKQLNDDRAKKAGK